MYHANKTTLQSIECTTPVEYIFMNQWHNCWKDNSWDRRNELWRE